MEDISPEILKYVLDGEEDLYQDLDNSTTTDLSISEDLDGEIIIEGEFLETGEESCTEEDVRYDVINTLSFSMTSEGAGDSLNSATIIFQEVLIEEESKVNFGKSSTPPLVLRMSRPAPQCVTSPAPAGPLCPVEDVCPRYIWCLVTPPAPLSLTPSLLRSWPRYTRLEQARHSWTYPGLSSPPLVSSSSGGQAVPMARTMWTVTAPPRLRRTPR